MIAKKIPRVLRIAVAILSMAAILLAFGSGSEVLSHFSRFQLGPHLAEIFAGATFGLLVGIVPAAVCLAAAFLFGRFYCSMFCPLGILQDFLGLITGRRGTLTSNWRTVRYVVATLTIGMLAGGWAAGFRYMDPFSIFGGIAYGIWVPVYGRIHSFLVPGAALPVPTVNVYTISGSLAILVILALLVWKKRRIFCVALCPVGTLLGVCSRFGIFRLGIRDKCVKCGRCAKVCPASCIDYKNRRIDNERCLRCMNCMSVCPVDAVRYGKPEKIEVAESSSRRGFLFGAAAAALGAGTGIALRPGGRLTKGPGRMQVYPPGAGSAARFKSKCTACHLCVGNCPGSVIKPGNWRNDTVHLEFDKGMCEFNCIACGKVCPTGAILPLSHEVKKRTRIGLAEFYPDICVAVKDRTDCGACAEHCPTGAMQMAEDSEGIRIPQLNKELCIGCGNCEFPCPVVPLRAVRVNPVPIQILVIDPAEYFRRQQPAKPKEAPEKTESGGWLI